MSGTGAGEKTELPSPKKIRDAREKGQVARSQEVVTTISLGAVIAYVWFSFGDTMERLIQLFDIVAALATGDVRSGMYQAMEIVFREVFLILLPVFGVVIVAGIAANYIQVGSIFAFDSIKPKLEKISLSSGAKKIFSMKSVVEIHKSVLKIGFLSILLYFVLLRAMMSYSVSLPCGLPCIMRVTAVTLSDIFISSMLAFMIVAVADLGYQRRAYRKSLMMSKEEVKREFKESEGDPHMKGHRKQIAQELLMSDSGQDTNRASAVVVNPTHFAVALRYVEGETPLPVVVAKGRDGLAYQIRSEAESLGIPIFRNIGLARALYGDVALRGYVSEELFGAVAEVLAWVEKNRGLLYQGRLAHGVVDMDAGDHRSSRS